MSGHPRPTVQDDVFQHSAVPELLTNKALRQHRRPRLPAVRGASIAVRTRESVKITMILLLV